MYFQYLTMVALSILLPQMQWFDSSTQCIILIQDYVMTPFSLLRSTLSWFTAVHYPCHMISVQSSIIIQSKSNITNKYFIQEEVFQGTLCTPLFLLEPITSLPIFAYILHCQTLMGLLSLCGSCVDHRYALFYLNFHEAGTYTHCCSISL